MLLLHIRCLLKGEKELENIHEPAAPIGEWLGHWTGELTLWVRGPGATRPEEDQPVGERRATLAGVGMWMSWYVDGGMDVWRKGGGAWQIQWHWLG